MDLDEYTQFAKNVIKDEAMIYPDLSTAVELIRAHDGQKDFSGRPYETHLYRVAYKLLPFGVDLAVAGLLHDILEDTKITFNELYDTRLNAYVLEIVQNMTHTKEVEYFSYITTIAIGDRPTIMVKLADLSDNLDVRRRLPSTNGLDKRHRKAQKMLQEALK